MNIEGNFLSRFSNRMDVFKTSLDQDKKQAESDMADYLIKCLPYLDAYAEADDDVDDQQTNTDNVFNVKETTGLARGDIYRDYLIDVEKANLPRAETRRTDTCPSCPDANVVHDVQTSTLICESCGLVLSQLVSEELTYREEQESTNKIVSYSYRRQNHFNEWIQVFQGQEQTNIPEEIVTQIRGELKKLKIADTAEITHARVRGILKKLKLAKYYEHVPYLTCQVAGVRPPQMSTELEERLRMLFNELQDPFDKVLADLKLPRKNFMSYSFTLYKLCELLGEDSYLPYLPLLKSKDKLFAQDKLWQGCCAILKWEFIPTV